MLFYAGISSIFKVNFHLNVHFHLELHLNRAKTGFYLQIVDGELHRAKTTHFRLDLLIKSCFSYRKLTTLF